MLFQKGDIVVCVDDSDAGSSGIKINKKYVVRLIYDPMYFYLFSIKEDGVVEKISHVFRMNRFMKLEEYRLNKIKKIKYNIKYGCIK